MRLKIRASTLWNNGRWKVQRRGNFNPPRHFASVDVDKRVTRAKAKLETPPPSLFHPRSIVDNFLLIPLSALVSFLLFKGCYNGGCNTMEEGFVEEWNRVGVCFGSTKKRWLWLRKNLFEIESVDSSFWNNCWKGYFLIIITRFVLIWIVNVDRGLMKFIR